MADESETKQEVPKKGRKLPEGQVSVRVTKFGADKGVSTGIHVAEQGDVMAKAGDIIMVDESTGRALEGKGLAEIQ